MIPSFLLFGTVWWIASLLTVRFFERRWLAPSSWFFFAFFLHGFVAPPAYLWAQDHRFFWYQAAEVFRLTFWFATMLTIGYVVFWLLSGARASKIAKHIEIPHDYKTTLSLICVMLLLVSLDLYAQIATGVFSLGRGAAGYSVGGLHTFKIIANGLSVIIPLALIVAWQRKQVYGEGAPFLFALAIALFFSAYNLALFERGAVILPLAIFAIFSLIIGTVSTSRVLLLAMTIFALVLGVAMLRSFGASLVELGISGAKQAAAGAFRDGAQALFFVATLIPGQWHFSQVIDIFERSEAFHWGATYLRSFVNVLLPASITGQHVYQTPAFWFKETAAPHLEYGGLDFSFLSEAYMNFGPFMILMGLGAGAILGALSKAAVNGSSFFSVYLRVAIVASLMMGLRHDSNALMKKVLLFSILIGLFALIAKYRGGLRFAKR
jgi:hypothetical protein